MDDQNVNPTNASAIELQKLVVSKYSIQQLSDVITELTKVLGPEESRRQLKEPGTFIEVLRRMLDMHTQQSLFIEEILKTTNDRVSIGEGYEVSKTDDQEGYTLKNSLMEISQDLNGAEVSGVKANLLILSRNNNIKKVFLYNSGFYIVIRSPKLAELNTLYNIIGNEFEEYGRMLGALFYMYSDMKIKEALIDFIELLTINSNLKQWDKGSRLRNNISIHDYQLILLQIATLMYKQGYLFKDVCLKCQKITELNIDLNSLQLTNFGMIPDDQRRQLATLAIIDNNQINDYRNSLGFNKSIDVGYYRLFLKVPSIGDYVKYGNEFNDEMVKSVHDFTDEDSIQTYMRFSYCSIYTPWIDSIGIIDESNNTKINFTVKDHDNILTILNEIQNLGLSEDFGEKMSDYIRSTSITNIGYVATNCEICNSIAENIINGIVPIDIQNSFFSILVMRLIQN